ncbi:hypothetical protein ED28_16760 [[Pantoea] beijingensis]|uniref:DUF2633 family protein n=1 Tax=[Pantoea] beijingensis TaxID=1324864 RepID=A0A443I9W0_9GAMM|nr:MULTISPECIES: YfgG family protein [Erwiniaceae]RWR00805.1 hypothetical protein ED28_16760 [[Pantoea] beijingensis]
MNNAMQIRKLHKTSKMTRIVLLISFIILIGRLLYTIPGAIEHHQQKKNVPETPTLSVPTSSTQ